MKKLWVAAAAIAAASLMTGSVVEVMTASAATTTPWAAPTAISVSSVTATGATVSFTLPSADRGASSISVGIYLKTGAPVTTTTVSASPAKLTGLSPSTQYFAVAWVNAGSGHSESENKASPLFTTSAGAVTEWAAPTSVSVSSVTATGATVSFTLPSADQGAASESVGIYTSSGAAVSVTTVTASPVQITGLSPSTGYYTLAWVNASTGHSESENTGAPLFTTLVAATPTPTPTPTTPTPTPTTPTPTPTPTTPTPTPTPTTPTPTPTPTTPTPTPTDTPTDTPTPTPTTPTPTPTPTPTTPTPTPTPSAPFAPALSSYTTLAQSYAATDIIDGGWAADANTTLEGGGTCPVANTSYSSSLDAVVMTTAGTAIKGNSTDCAHIRSQYTVPTSGDVVEAKIWLPSTSTTQTFGGSSYPAGTLLDWASMWTDGADSTNGPENWPADTEVDAVETQYGTSYVSVHYGSVAKTGGSTGDWTTEPNGWEPAGAIYATPNTGVADVQGGWNVVDIEFTSTVANIYINGGLYVTIPSSTLSHKPAYLNFGIAGPNGNDSNYPKWPAGPATEDVQYVRVFSPPQ